MGMAASQGRFLSLTARKSNTEYEGQQVNQQRTILANQSAALNSQMLALNVPTPPDAEQYYNDQYVFEDGDKKMEIISGLGRESTIVREEVTQYRLYSQPVNMGLPVVLTMLNNKLLINNNEMTMLSANSSRNQIRNILDNGQAGDNPPFMCIGTVEGTGYTRVNDNAAVMNDASIQKYINEYSVISLPITTGSTFEKNFANGIPSYYVKTDALGNQTFTLLTSANKDKLIEDAKLNDNAQIVQENRDKYNHSVKVPVSQEKCNAITGLDFYTAEDIDVTWEKATDSSTGQVYLTAAPQDASELALDSSLSEKMSNNSVVLFERIKDNTSGTGYIYQRIEDYEKLLELLENDDDVEIYKLVDPKQGSGSIPTDGDLVDPNSIIGIPVASDDTSDYGNFAKYTKAETTKTKVEGPFELTQAMWDAAKKDHDTELMDYYIECLNFSEEDEASRNNYLYYYVNSSKVHYVQSSWIPEDLIDGTTEAEQVEIDQEYYEHAYDEFIDQTFTNCMWQKDNSSGRYVSFTGKNDAGVTKTYNLVYTRVKDDNGYDQALMDYEYRKAEYEKAVSDINAKTATIQQEDKTLELRLKSLDTEQQALSQELEAVQKVIRTNVEKTFNTFSK